MQGCWLDEEWHSSEWTLRNTTTLQDCVHKYPSAATTSSLLNNSFSLNLFLLTLSIAILYHNFFISVFWSVQTDKHLDKNKIVSNSFLKFWIWLFEEKKII